MSDICKHCGHNHEAWGAEAAKCDKTQVAQLRTDLAELKAKDLEQYNEWTTRVEKAEADLAAANEQILDGKRLANTYMDELAKADKENKRLTARLDNFVFTNSEFAERIMKAEADLKRYKEALEKIA